MQKNNFYILIVSLKIINRPILESIKKINTLFYDFKIIFSRSRLSFSILIKSSIHGQSQDFSLLFQNTSHHICVQKGDIFVIFQLLSRKLQFFSIVNNNFSIIFPYINFIKKRFYFIYSYCKILSFTAFSNILSHQYFLILKTVFEVVIKSLKTTHAKFPKTNQFHQNQQVI